MIISSMIVVFSFLLDGILSNFLPFMVGRLSFFTPLFTVMSVFLIYPFYKKKEKHKYFLTIGIVGIIYDLAFTNLLFFHMILFLLLGLLTIFFYRYLDTNFLMILIESVLIISVYQILSSLFFILFQVVPISFDDFLYLLEHTLLINVLYGEFVFLMIKFLPKKYLGLSIN